MVSAALIGLLTLIVVGTAEANDALVIGPPPPPRSESSPLDQFTVTQGSDGAVLREPPVFTLKKPGAIVPFAGLGFSRGTTTDTSGTVMRGIGQQSTLQEDRVLHDMVGKTVAPNEVQVGIRLPF